MPGNQGTSDNDEFGGLASLTGRRLDAPSKPCRPLELRRRYRKQKSPALGAGRGGGEIYL